MFCYMLNSIETLHDRSLRRTAVMTLGAIASRLRSLGRYKEANQIVSSIENDLGIHGLYNLSSNNSYNDKIHE